MSAREWMGVKQQRQKAEQYPDSQTTNREDNMCLNPRLIYNRKFSMTKKNGGIIPPVIDERTKYVPIGCGECIECRKQKANNWRTRLLQEVRDSKNGKFVTLTFTNASYTELSKQVPECEGYVLDNAIATRAIRLFNERWRKKFKKAPRHWLITELGHEGTERIHLHGIIFTNESMDEIERVWKYGFVWKGKGDRKENYVTERTANYITKYITKLDPHHKTYKAKVLCSPGIGAGYIHTEAAKHNAFKEGETKETFTMRNGREAALPVYYRNKIYTEEERERLWIEKLNKQERYVLGQKVSVKNGDEQYMRMLREAQEKNERLGFGKGVINWEEKKYRNKMRHLSILKKILKAR